jgi:ketosteroid isomerase-like protein
VSQEDAELVRRAFEGAPDLEKTAEAHWHPEIEYVEDPRWPGASRYKGRDAVLGCFRAYTEALGREEDFTITVERLFDAGERHVPFVRFQSRASTSGIPHEHLWGYVVEGRDGRIVYFRAYYEPDEALEAVGLRK